MNKPKDKFIVKMLIAIMLLSFSMVSLGERIPFSFNENYGAETSTVSIANTISSNEHTQNDSSAADHCQGTSGTQQCNNNCNTCALLSLQSSFNTHAVQYSSNFTIAHYASTRQEAPFKPPK